ncbi:MAG: hypothetical protein K5893_11495 [Prevotella sp.]|nr:hypothetical protein [Prevotella sp.]
MNFVAMMAMANVRLTTKETMKRRIELASGRPTCPRAHRLMSCSCRKGIFTNQNADGAEYAESLHCMASMSEKETSFGMKGQKYGVVK